MTMMIVTVTRAARLRRCRRGARNQRYTGRNRIARTMPQSTAPNNGRKITTKASETAARSSRNAQSWTV